NDTSGRERTLQQVAPGQDEGSPRRLICVSIMCHVRAPWNFHSRFVEGWPAAFSTGHPISPAARAEPEPSGPGFIPCLILFVPPGKPDQFHVLSSILIGVERAGKLLRKGCNLRGPGAASAKFPWDAWTMPNKKDKGQKFSSSCRTLCNSLSASAYLPAETFRFVHQLDP